MELACFAESESLLVTLIRLKLGGRFVDRAVTVEALPIPAVGDPRPVMDILMQVIITAKFTSDTIGAACLI